MGTLSVREATKRYGKVTAVDRVSFDVRPGRILGFLGPNGAGKTSTIRLIANITAPDQGAVLFDGRDVGPWSQKLMGYMPEERGLYKKLKVADQLLYLAALKGVRRAEAKKKIQYWAERFGLEKWMRRKTQELSKGMQQKVQFMATILPEPRLLILDEPFSGLDPINSELLREIIFELRSDGRTILFASHRMEQVEQLCDDICLIARGKVLVHGDMRKVKQRYGRNTLLLEYEGDGAFLHDFKRMGRVQVQSQDVRGVELKVVDAKAPREILSAMIKQNVTIYRYELAEPPLTEIFIQEVEGMNGEDGA